MTFCQAQEGRFSGNPRIAKALQFLRQKERGRCFSMPCQAFHATADAMQSLAWDLLCCFLYCNYVCTRHPGKDSACPKYREALATFFPQPKRSRDWLAGGLPFLSPRPWAWGRGGGSSC